MTIFIYDNTLTNLFNEACDSKKNNEDTGAGAVAGFSAPMGDKNDVVRKKTVIDEISQEEASDKTITTKNFELTTSYRGPEKGYSIMVRQLTGEGKAFLDEQKLNKIINFIESIF